MKSTHTKTLYKSQFVRFGDFFFSNFAIGSHFGFMRIPGVAQSCGFCNQAKFALIPHRNTNLRKNFIGKEISRSPKFLLD